MKKSVRVYERAEKQRHIYIYAGQNQIQAYLLKLFAKIMVVYTMVALA